MGNGYYVVAISGNCTSQTSTANVTSGAPTIFTLTGSTASCLTSTGTITLSNSQTGVSYQLRNSSNSNVQPAKSGIGSSLTWAGVVVGNGFYVVATNAGNCTSQTGTADVTTAAAPTAYTLTGSAATCSLNTGTVTLSNSETGISYQLRNGGNNNVQVAKSGTGSSLTWTGVAEVMDTMWWPS